MIKALLLIIVGLCVSQAHALEYQATPSNYRELLSSLKPGDKLILTPGTYTRGLSVYNLNGEPDNPIIVEGPAVSPRAVFTGSDTSNVIRIKNSSYVELRNLELDGQKKLGDGVKAGNCNWAHHITIENFLIYNFDPNRARVGISTNGCVTWNWVIRGNVILSAGTGMYLGNSDGSEPFIAGLIENNIILDTIGYNIQIKHQKPRPADIPGIPTADNVTIIRNNVFSKLNNGDLGGNARPNLLVGHWPLSGVGQNDRYEIYGNFFYHNHTGEALFQGEGNLSLYNNIFMNRFSGRAINIQAHNDAPKEIMIFNNTVLAAGTGIRVSGANSQHNQRLVANAIFAPAPIAGAWTDNRDNITDSYSSVEQYLTNPLADIGLDMYPRQGKLTGSAVDYRHFQALTDWNVDFNGDAYQTGFRGAYSGEGQNPGWRLKLEKKP